MTESLVRDTTEKLRKEKEKNEGIFNPLQN